uniref:SAM-dependent methyltransferase n=1 Tax=Macrostomum lignano TaxID=282301 RepID=A0A1I8HHU1_9PLAT
MPKPDNQEQLESLGLELEPSWDRVVAPEAAIWELLQTEVNILRHLKTIIE